MTASVAQKAAHPLRTARRTRYSSCRVRQFIAVQLAHGRPAGRGYSLRRARHPASSRSACGRLSWLRRREDYSVDSAKSAVDQASGHTPQPTLQHPEKAGGRDRGGCLSTRRPHEKRMPCAKHPRAKAAFLPQWSATNGNANGRPTYPARSRFPRTNCTRWPSKLLWSATPVTEYHGIPRSGEPVSRIGHGRFPFPRHGCFPLGRGAFQRTIGPGGFCGRSQQWREGRCRAHGPDARGYPAKQGAPAEWVEAPRPASLDGWYMRAPVLPTVLRGYYPCASHRRTREQQRASDVRHTPDSSARVHHAPLPGCASLQLAGRFGVRFFSG